MSKFSKEILKGIFCRKKLTFFPQLSFAFLQSYGSMLLIKSVFMWRFQGEYWVLDWTLPSPSYSRFLFDYGFIWCKVNAKLCRIWRRISSKYTVWNEKDGKHFPDSCKWRFRQSYSAVREGKLPKRSKGDKKNLLIHVDHGPVCIRKEDGEWLVVNDPEVQKQLLLWLFGFQ